MSESNNFIYLVMKKDLSTGKWMEWVMYAFDTFSEAEDAVKHHNQQDSNDYPLYFMKSVRYFRKGVV